MSDVAVDESQFEAPLIELRRQIEELEGYPEGAGRRRELARLERELRKQTAEVYGRLTAWQTTLVARNAERPYALDWIGMLTEEFVELHGDRCFGDDPAIVGGPARYRGEPVMVLGHQKGRGTKERIRRNFGQPNPEGYRKALRLMKLAERFAMPILTFIDTPGAYPGRGAEERGQAEAVARNLIEMAALEVPIVSVVTGEGGSGGALALGVANHVYMLEHSVYSVISPEGCAAILWKEQEGRSLAAAAMRVTANELDQLGLVDGVLEEPIGGAHLDPGAAAQEIDKAIADSLATLGKLRGPELVEQRYERFRALGAYRELR